MTVASPMKRREFLKAGAALGGGLIISLYVPDFVPPSAAASARTSGAAAESSKPIALNAFVHIAPDEIVTVISNHSEMGQGIYTSLPMLINEELEQIGRMSASLPLPLPPSTITPCSAL